MTVKHLVPLILLVTAGFASLNAQEAVLDIITFSHQLHIEDVEVECETCHEGAADSTYYGFPTMDVCSECHEDYIESDD